MRMKLLRPSTDTSFTFLSKLDWMATRHVDCAPSAIYRTVLYTKCGVESYGVNKTRR